MSTVDRSASPYYDDFDPSKGYVSICQVPGRLEQAREFTQIQTEMHEQLKNLAGTKFTNGQVISGCLATINGAKTRVTISAGSVYADGYIVQFSQPSVVVITGMGTEVIGLVQTEEIVTEKEDASLKGPVPGLRNYGEAGSHRLKISWAWAKLSGNTVGYEYLRLQDGAVPGAVTTSSVLDPKKPEEKTNYLDIDAKRDYDQSGNYILEGLEVKIADHPDPALLFEKKELRVSAGKGRILGYNYSLAHDWRGDFEIARETSEVFNEPYTMTDTQDQNWESEKFKVGGEIQVAEGPVDEILELSAPVLFVSDGHDYGGDVHPLIVRGLTPGGTDVLPHSPVEDIIDVALGPNVRFNPATNLFENFTTHYVKGVDYQVTSTGISWSLSGAEPAGGNSYAVAFVARVDLKKEILANALVTNEIVNHNDTEDGDKLDHQFVCPPTFYNNYEMCLTGSAKTGLPGKDFHSDYTWNQDFVIDDDGRIDWFEHDITIIQVTKGVAGGSDTIGNGSGNSPLDFVNGYGFERVLAVAYYSNPAQMSFNKDSLSFVGPTSTYNNTTDYTWQKGVSQISWAPSGAEPSVGQTYFIAVRSRRYLTQNHPAPGANYYVNYYYWQRKIGGDYIARDSFYTTWYGEDDSRNVRNRYGFGIRYSYLTAADYGYSQYINFWGTQSSQNNAGNVNKPYPGGELLVSYTYCLNRYVTIELTENLASPINVVYGGSSENPVEPIYDQNRRAVMLAIVYSPADTFYYPTIIATGTRTLKVSDLNVLKDRCERTEINLATTWVDLDAATIPVENKKGMITSAFHDDKALDRGWPGVVYSFDPDYEELCLPHLDSFYNVSSNPTGTTGHVYDLICTLAPNGTYSVTQPYWTKDESIAPYAAVCQLPDVVRPQLPVGEDPPQPQPGQPYPPQFVNPNNVSPNPYAGLTEELQKAQSAYMCITPAGDTLIIPRLVNFASQTDAEAWTKSDVSKLSNPTQWFSQGKVTTSEVVTEQKHIELIVTKWDYSWPFADPGVRKYTDQAVTATYVTNQETLTREYIRDIQGNCRQLLITWSIPGGLVRPQYIPNIDFFLYFAEQGVPITLTGGTPAGSVANSFRPRADGSASGTFMIPANVPEGRVPVRASSNPMPLPNGNTWTQTVTAIYDASVVEKITQSVNKTTCRCNCWCNCVCNCWGCRGRCGTGPLAQTLEPIGHQRVLKEIMFDFSHVNPKYGVYGCVIETQNGEPTTNTVSNAMIGRKLLTAEQLVGGGEKVFTFDSPVIWKDDTYALVATGEDAFNINSVNEVLAGRDIRCKVAVLGEKDLSGTNATIGSQPFKDGVLFRSLTAVTWEQDQKADMKFRATFYTYPVDQEQIIYLDTVVLAPGQEATAFLLNWDSQLFDGTSITFEFRTQAGVWQEFSPYTLTKCNEEAVSLQFRARLKTTSEFITPTVNPMASLYTQSRALYMKAVTIDYTVTPSDTLDIYLDTHLPSDCTEAYNVTLDNGQTFIPLDPPINGQPIGNLVEYTPVDLNVTNVKYRHHWRITMAPGQIFTSFRLQMEIVAGGTDAKLKDPRLSRMIMIASVVL
jgi:hypothetical protein